MACIYPGKPVKKRLPGQKNKAGTFFRSLTFHVLSRSFYFLFFSAEEGPSSSTLPQAPDPFRHPPLMNSFNCGMVTSVLIVVVMMHREA